MPELPAYEEALHPVLHGTPVLPDEVIMLEDAVGRVLAAPVVADRDQPPFDRSAMDGYAVRASELEADTSLPVAGTVAAGQPADLDVPAGHCVAIATGAPVPDGLDLVVPHERTDRGDRHGGPVRFDAEGIETGYAIHPRGADAKTGDQLVSVGTILSPAHIGLAATVGLDRLPVRRRPRIRLLTSGDEIVDRTADPLPHQVRNGNGPMLEGLVGRMGAEFGGHVHVDDDPSAVRAALEHAVEQADIVVTVGGISAGDRDFLPDAIEGLGATTVLAGAAIQPGKPIRVGRLASGTTIVSLPGNPVSVLATACLFLWPLVRTMLGCSDGLPWRTVRLAGDVRPNPRRHAFRPATIDDAGDATVPTWHGSGDLSHTTATDGLVALPRQADPVPDGTRLRFLPWP